MIKLKLTYNELLSFNTFLSRVYNHIDSDIKNRLTTRDLQIDKMKYNADLDEVKRLLIKVSAALLKTMVKSQKHYTVQITKTQGFILFSKNLIIPKDEYTLALMETVLTTVNQALI